VSPTFKDYYPNFEYPCPDFLKDTNTLRDLIFAMQRVTILQESLSQWELQNSREEKEKNVNSF
jgi:hypothetical protein